MDYNLKTSRLIHINKTPRINYEDLMQEIQKNTSLLNYLWVSTPNNLHSISTQYPMYIQDLCNALYNNNLHYFECPNFTHIDKSLAQLLNYLSMQPYVLVNGPSIAYLFMAHSHDLLPQYNNLDPYPVIFYQSDTDSDSDDNDNCDKNFEDKFGASNKTSTSKCAYQFDMDYERQVNVNIYILGNEHPNLNSIITSYLYKIADNDKNLITKRHIITTLQHNLVKYTLKSPRIILYVNFVPYPTLTHLLLNVHINAMGIFWSPYNNRWLLTEQALFYIRTLNLTLLYKKNGPDIDAYQHEIMWYPHRSLQTIALE